MSRAPAKSVCCGHCVHFDQAPQSLEARIQGLRVMGSAYSSVRANDGLCGHRDRYLSADYSCDNFTSIWKERD